MGCGVVRLILVSCIAVPNFIRDRGGFSLLCLIPFYAAGIGMIVWGVAPTFRAMKITPPEVHVSNKSVRLGESFDFRFHQVIKDRLDVDFVKAVFVMRETATYRRGTNTYTETHEIPVETKGIREARTLRVSNWICRTGLQSLPAGCTRLSGGFHQKGHRGSSEPV